MSKPPNHPAQPAPPAEKSPSAGRVYTDEEFSALDSETQRKLIKAGWACTAEKSQSDGAAPSELEACRGWLYLQLKSQNCGKTAMDLLEDLGYFVDTEERFRKVVLGTDISATPKAAATLAADGDASRALNVTTLDGKYTVQMSNSGELRALRHGTQWRDCIGDQLILTLAQDIETLTHRLDAVKNDKRLIEGVYAMANRNIDLLKGDLQQTSSRLKEAQARVAELEADLAESKRNYDGACKLVADMHAAAMGKVCGPVKGVVEDVANAAEQAVAKERAEILAMWTDFGPDVPAMDECAKELTRMGYDVTGTFMRELHARLANPASAEKGAL